MRENRSEPFVLPDAAIEGADQPPDEWPVDPRMAQRPLCYGTGFIEVLRVRLRVSPS
jgi:hypothetical protein